MPQRLAETKHKGFRATVHAIQQLRWDEKAGLRNGMR
jgi:hypothetical protein